MTKIAIIVGSTRPGRKAPAVAQWVYDAASQRTDATFEIVDLLAFDLPLLDEPMPPAMGKYIALRFSRNASRPSWASSVM
jgi:NAD(P)H-dependent FMN reductase